MRRLWEWVFSEWVAAVRRDAYRCGREDAVRDVQDAIADINGYPHGVIGEVVDGTTLTTYAGIGRFGAPR